MEVMCTGRFFLTIPRACTSRLAFRRAQGKFNFLGSSSKQGFFLGVWPSRQIINHDFFGLSIPARARTGTGTTESSTYFDILDFCQNPEKTASNKLAKLLSNFMSLAKFSLHLANMPSPPSLGITCIPVCQLVLPTCWRLNFMILTKILVYQVFLPSPNSKLMEKASFSLGIWF